MKERQKKTHLLAGMLGLLLMLALAAGSAFADDGTDTEITIPEIKGWDTNVMTNESKLWINEANFPDAAFRQYILDHFDSDGNYSLDYPEILKYTSINVEQVSGVGSLEGIEHFENLRDLQCGNTDISAVPAQAFEFLEVLDCHNTKIASLDVSKCTRLTSLNCSQTEITSIDVNACPNLTTLFCSKTGITSLDLSRQTELRLFDCSQTGISTLDLSKNTNLTSLFCDKTGIIALDLTTNTALTTVSCGENQLLCVNLPDGFTGTFAAEANGTADFAQAIPAVSVVNGSADLREAAATIRSSSISNVKGADLSGTTLNNAAAGTLVTYTYDCGNGNTISCRVVLMPSKGLTKYITPSKGSRSGTTVKMTVDAASSLTLLAELSASGASGAVLNLADDAVMDLIGSLPANMAASIQKAETTILTAPASFFTSLADRLSADTVIRTEHGTYILSSAQLRAIGSSGSSSTAVTVTFGPDQNGKDAILVKGDLTEGTLSGSSIVSEETPEEPQQPATDKNASIIAGVQKTTITVTSTVGKGYIKLNWKKSAGYKVDYYEVFRSTKKSSGYGTKAFYTTTSGSKLSYKNTKQLKKGTRYYFKVRGVRIIDGKRYYTQWSNKTWRIAK